MRNIHRFTGSLAALGLVTVTSLAAASSHKEAPAISFDPAADNTDVWAWADGKGAGGAAQNVWIIASYNPLEEPNGGPNFAKFSDNVLYQIHVARGDTSLNDAITYNIQFTTGAIQKLALGSLPKGGGGGNVGGGQEFFAQLAGSLAQTYTVTKIVAGSAPVVVASGTVAPPNIGPRTDVVVNTPTFTGSNGGYSNGAAAFMDFFVTAAGSDGTIAWAGPSDDAFYVDLARVFDLAAFAGSAPPATKFLARNGVSGYNVHTIALQIPATVLNGGTAPTAGAPGVFATNDPQTLGIWASASRRKVRILRADGTEENYGPWTQVSRLGFPLINEAVIGVQDKDKYNRTTPATDLANFGAYILNPVIVQDAIAVGVYANAAGGAPFATGRTDIVDVLGANNIPQTNSHNFGGSLDEDGGAGTTVGDVLRLDLGFESGFPNGRVLGENGGTSYTANCYLGGIAAALCGTNQNQEHTQVSDAILSVFLVKATSVVAQGATHNDVDYQTVFPYVAPPWSGSDQGHGCLDTDSTFPCRQ